jgi:hypothetical protein
MARFPVSGFAESTLCAYAEEDWSGADGLGDPGIHAVVLAYRAGNGKALVVDRATYEAVWSGLVDLSNTEDEIAENERKQPVSRRDPERMRYARAACVGLSNLGTRIARTFL